MKAFYMNYIEPLSDVLIVVETIIKLKFEGFTSSSSKERRTKWTVKKYVKTKT
jgi:hypothetical protein